MSYTRIIQIEFNHCDPAGVVFYPRYFEMINSVVENFFADVVGRSFAAMHLGGTRNGVPTVRIEAEFTAPSRLGDKVEFALTIAQLGSRSLTLQIGAACGDEPRLRARITLMWVEGMRAVPWPAEMRTQMMAFQSRQDTA